MEIFVATLRGGVHQQQRAAAYAALMPSLQNSRDGHGFGAGVRLHFPDSGLNSFYKVGVEASHAKVTRVPEELCVLKLVSDIVASVYSFVLSSVVL